MGILSRIARAVRRTVRYKLLLLVLFPIVLVMPIALGLAVYWSRHFGYDQLFIKVNTDLSVAHDAFERAQRDYMDAVGRMAESYRFRTDYHRGDDASLRRLLANVQTRYGFAFLHLVNRQGQRLLGKGDISSPLLEQAAMGEPGAGIEILSAGQLAREDPALAARVRLPLLPTPRATPTDRRFEDRGIRDGGFVGAHRIGMKIPEAGPFSEDCIVRGHGAAPLRRPCSLGRRVIRFRVRDGAPAHDQKDDSGHEKKSSYASQAAHLMLLSFVGF
jgi:hypothetical protein